jgi:hypothetical protein
VNANRRSGFNTNSPSPPAVSTATLKECSSLLFVLDPEAAATRVADGVQPCPASECSGFFQPWGSARTRPVRLLGGGTDSVTPRRARCRQCDRTHVFIPSPGVPETHRQHRDRLGGPRRRRSGGWDTGRSPNRSGVPATTVRGWLRRARANSEIIANRARIFRSDLELYKPDRLPKFDTPLACMVHTVAGCSMRVEATLRHSPTGARLDRHPSADRVVHHRRLAADRERAPLKAVVETRLTPIPVCFVAPENPSTTVPVRTHTPNPSSP